MSESVTIWYLEQSQREQWQPVPDPGGIDVREARVRQYRVNRFLYELVGAPWGWTDKLPWTDVQWRDYAERDTLRTWIATVDGSPAGYFELERRNDNSVELCYFGLAEAFIGRGFGGYLLSRAIEEAWNWDAASVTVNTCSLDHPGALKNYQARGFEIVRTVTD